MKNGVVVISACIMLLTAGLSQASGKPEGDLTLSQFELDSLQGVSQAMADGCSESYPALRTELDDAVETFGSRAGPIIDDLLETERFRHLASVEVPQQMVENYIANREVIRAEAVNAPEAQCKGLISEMAMSDEQLRALLTDSLDGFDRCRFNPDCY